MKSLYGVAILMAMGTASYAATPEETLENRVRENSTMTRPVTPPSAVNSIRLLKFLRQNKDAQAPVCNEARKATFGGRYVISYDAANQPCRIYDLSFPTFKTLFARKPVSRMPVQKVTAQDYLNWAEGRYDEVYKQLADVKSNFEPHAAVTASWVSQLKFREDTEGGLRSESLRTQGELPKSFHASDLDVGNFQFSEADRANLKGLMGEAKAMAADQGLQVQAATEDAWETLADKPQTALQKIRFDWNDADKVYDVFLEGEFLPMRGPVSLVDFNQTYKGTVEAMLRTVMKTSLRALIGVIPLPAAKDLIDIAVTDTFDFMDLAYAYQQNQLEETLRLASLTPQDGTDPAVYNRALDILFGSRSDLLTSYLVATLTGKKFDWKDIEKLGKTARYTAEKTRDIAVTNMNSRMVLKDKCSMALVDNAFGICTRDNKKVAIYSMLSTTKILNMDLGAPVVFNYARPSDVMMRRATSWFLSAAVRVVHIPIVNSLKYSLANLLKGYAKSGMTDEAFLRAALSNNASNLSAVDTTLSTDTLTKWLYVQNINPFLPKSAAMEKQVIQANAALLGVSVDSSTNFQQPRTVNP